MEKKKWPRTIALATIERAEKGCEWHKTYNYYYSMFVTGKDPMHGERNCRVRKRKRDESKGA